MADAWYAIVALLLTGYVVMDGFDLGAGALHQVVAKTDEERRGVLAAIGPFWDGNEVFLIAAGGALFAAFPRALASALSGLYLAVLLLLWAFLLRGLSIELRGHLRDPMWRAAWDAVFQGSSLALCALLGVALGGLLRGFPLDEEGWFSLELFSLASPREARAIVDGYTLSVGLFAALALAAHGARFLAWKAEGPVHERASALAARLQLALVPAWLAVIALTALYAPASMRAFAARPAASAPLALAVAGLVISFRAGRLGRSRAAFLGSAAFLVGLMALAGACSHPVLVRASGEAARSLTTTNAQSEGAALQAGLSWWFFSAALVAGYFVNLFRLHRGKLTPAKE